MKQDSYGKYIEDYVFIDRISNKKYVIKRYNNNWRKFHGFSVLRGNTKFRLEVFKI